jgi:hypothetical protein
MRFTPEDYAELLGFYLGDGWISDLSRTQRLRIALDTKYPKIIASAKGLLRRCFPHNPVSIVPYHDGSGVYVSNYRQTFDRRRELWNVRINRRGSVTLMLEHVGLKE